MNMQNIKKWYLTNGFEYLSILVPLVIYYLLTHPFNGWIIDDAGISFVYSRNLAEGYGLVSQPGMVPVEGYSNFLWVLLMAPFFVLGIFDPFITSKAVSFVLVALTFWFLHRSIKSISGCQWFLSFIVLLFLSFNTSFVSWTCSGLENPLFALLVSILLFLLITGLTKNKFSVGRTVLVALIAVCIALTRPDGIIYAIAFPITLSVGDFSPKHNPFRSFLKELGVYTVCYALVYGGFLLFRWLYFNDLYPNTYYVKGGPTAANLVDVITLSQPYVVKLRDLLASIIGTHVWVAIPIFVILWIGTIVARKDRWRQDVVLLTLTVLSLLAYLLLARDWMGEYRFATPFFPLLYASLAVSCYRLIKNTRFSLVSRRVFSGIIIVLMALLILQTHYPRFKSRWRHPRVSFAGIAQNFGVRFNNYAEFLELEDASLLVSELGGALYYSKLRIYDLAGLCDRTIAQTMRKDQPAFYDYVFEKTKPTFIYTSGSFTIASRFDEDDRFVRDYLAIHEAEDKYAGKVLKRKIMSGCYIRRDAVLGKEEKLAALRAGKFK